MNSQYIIYLFSLISRKQLEMLCKNYSEAQPHGQFRDMRKARVLGRFPSLRSVSSSAKYVFLSLFTVRFTFLTFLFLQRFLF